MQWNMQQRVSKTKKKPNPRRDIKELMKMRKTMRKKLETTKDETEKIHLEDRIRIIREQDKKQEYDIQTRKKKVEVTILKRQQKISEKM